MPPRKPGRGIVKSGNAGNSSKGSVTPQTASEPPKNKPLFPLGSKYPLSLLNERCQKNGWEAPEVITRHHSSYGYSFVVVLRKLNKKTSQVDSVRLEPHPPYYAPTALEAKHWGATYALYRVCNNIQLNRVLPPGPREYWTQLEQEHKAAPEHQKWMYDPDPFLARKEVDARQEAAENRREGSQTPSERKTSSIVANEFAGAIEVKMSGTLRDLVEDAIRKTHDSRIQSLQQSEHVLPRDLHPELTQSLKLLMFTPVQIERTLKALSIPAPLTSSLLLSSPAPLDAAVSHLLLCIPECDLPARFLQKGAGESFVQSAHKGTEDIKAQWLIQQGVKEAGYPEYIVRKTVRDLSEDSRPPTWADLIDKLNQRLVGKEWSSFASTTANLDLKERDDQRSLEISTMESMYPLMTTSTSSAHSPENFISGDVENTIYINIPIPSTPLVLHLILKNSHPYPHSTISPPMYISSESTSRPQANVAPYVRLHLLSKVLLLPSIIDRGDGEGIGLLAASVIEEEWLRILADGPPELGDVLKNLTLEEPEKPSNEEQPVSSSPVMKRSKRMPKSSQGHSLDDRIDSEIVTDFKKMRVGPEYQTLLAARTNLPAWSAKEQFLTAFESSRVIVCVGETGSGKTTQVPQFILDSYLENKTGSYNHVRLQEMQIIVTQPRRVAAVSVASRVSAERGNDGSVAYTIRGESTASRRTKLLFCTTGVVLRRLTVGDGLQGVNVILVDEVHERSVDNDFLLLELRELLKKNKNLKLVLLSATINQNVFLDYFKGASLVTIPGRTYPVEDIYLEDVISRLSYVPSPVKPTLKQTEEQLVAFRKLYESRGLDQKSVRSLEILVRSERIDYQLISSLIRYIVANKPPGAILIFLPGVQEISRCIQALKGLSAASTLEVFPLHANLSSNEQKAVFCKTIKRKVVVATNVAETSITIDDVVYVIDAGKVKETSYDPETGLSGLTETWVTKAAARQRRGRAGRTKPGECYKLYTREKEQEMGDFPVPEILRASLESLSLAVKAVRENEDVKHFLAKAIDPPPLSAMEKAWAVLEELGAVDQNGKLTPLGRHMSLLPVDLRLGKMLILGAIFNCLDPILTVAACLSSKPLFISSMDKREEATKARFKFAFGNSDLLTDMHAYHECMKISPQAKLFAFCEQNFISYTTLRDISSLRDDLLAALLSAGFSSHLPTSNLSPPLLQSIITAGLYPRIARITLPTSAIKFDKVQGGAVQRAQDAREFKLFDLENLDGPGRGQRIFLHPTSILFGQDKWKEHFVCYFRKAITTKPFLRDATEVPLFAVLLFGGPISINHISGRLTIAGRENSTRIAMKAWPRIGVLANQLRHLLNEQLSQALETASLDIFRKGNPVLEAILALLTRRDFEA